MISEKLLDIVKHYEGLRLHPYIDAAGYATIGYGHKIVPGDLDFSKGITEQEAEALLIKDLTPKSRGVRRLIRVELNQDQLDALTDFAFNLGYYALKSSTLLRRINEGTWGDAEIKYQFSRWVFAGGRKLTGLILRRETEGKLYTGEKWKYWD